MHIALRHLVPKQMRANGVKEDEVRVEESAVREIIRYYTREAGVRGLERSIGKVLRKIVLTVLEEKTEKTELPVVVTNENIATYLGVRRYSITESQRDRRSGSSTGSPGRKSAATSS